MHSCSMTGICAIYTTAAGHLPCTNLWQLHDNVESSIELWSDGLAMLSLNATLLNQLSIAKQKQTNKETHKNFMKSAI